jgi:hypothetical protein
MKTQKQSKVVQVTPTHRCKYVILYQKVMKTQKHSKVVQVSWDLELENKIVSIGLAVGIRGK